MSASEVRVPHGSAGPLLPQRPSRGSPRAILGAFSNAVLLYPLLLCFALYCEWFVAWHTLGHAPRPSLDDPKDIVETWLLHRATEVLLMGFLPAAAAAFVLAVADSITRRRGTRRLVQRIAMILLLWGLVIALVRWDSGQVLSWWFD